MAPTRTPMKTFDPMRTLRFSSLLLLFLIPMLMQAQETLVPVDSAFTLDHIDAATEAKLGL